MTPARRIQLLCRLCAATIHTGAIDPAYSESVARLLFLTIAHESDSFRARRQYGFRPETTTGAFGLAQTEKGSMDLSTERMHRPDAIGASCQAFLDCCGVKMPVNTRAAMLAVQVPQGDALSVLLCRLHYLRVREPVPASQLEQAVYAKAYYNTRFGKATPEHYIRAFDRHWPD